MLNSSKATAITGSYTVSAGECWLTGFYVNNTSSLAFTLVNGLAGSTGAYIKHGTITPAIGFHNIPIEHFPNALNVVVSAGTGNVTFYTLES